MPSPDITILVPTLGRPHALGPLAENVAATAPVGSYNLVFVVDRDDEASHKALRAIEHPFRAVVADGTYPAKINAGYRQSAAPFVLPTADDVIFHKGWLAHALAAFTPGIEVVGTCDLTPATADGDHATMPILRRAYCQNPGAAYDETGTVFHEGYRHNYVETETCGLAQHRGVWTFQRASVIEHLHPDWGTRAEDETDRRGNRCGVDDDRDLFFARRDAWSKS